jgi:sugar lactone lactonase YvrE
MRFVLGLVVAIIAGISLLLALPAPIDPVSWTPDPNPGLTGHFEPNRQLAETEFLLDGLGVGPEDVACTPSGGYYTGFEDGRIVFFDAAGDYTERMNTGGRPLGMQLDAAGRLIVADAIRGILAVSGTGEIEVLTDSVAGEKMLFVDDLDIAADGVIWFSDASTRYDYAHSMYDFLEGQPTGRLLSYDPASGETRVHLDKLFFANGVALGPNDDYVLVNETGAGRIHRLWLKGEKAGQRDLFASGLPGTPDNISFNGRDMFWVAMPMLREASDALAGYPLLRKLLSHLPVESLGAGATPYSLVIGLNLNGEVIQNLQDIDAGFHMITSANECDGKLYLGSVMMSAVGRYPL